MASRKRQLKRKLIDDPDKSSDSEDEFKDSSINKKSRNKISLGSDSERGSESDASDQSHASKNKMSESSSDEIEILGEEENSSRKRENSVEISSDDESPVKMTKNRSKSCESLDEDEPISKFVTSKLSGEFKPISSIYTDSSDEETVKRSIENKKSSYSGAESDEMSKEESDKSEKSTDEDEPLSKWNKTSKQNEESNGVSSKQNEESNGLNTSESCSSDEDESTATSSKHSATNKTSRTLESKKNGHEISSDEDPLTNNSPSKKKENSKKIHNSSGSSDDENFAVKKSAKHKFNKKENDHTSSEEDKPISLSKGSKQKTNSKNKNSSNDKIENLKKYLRLAGIHINSYDKLFENCKSIKSKVEKLMSILNENGMKGRPTIEKCKKLKKRIETKKEIAELDTSNIIKSEGRPKRGEKAIQKKQNIQSSPIKNRFSRLKDIIDSEESD